MSCCSGQTQTRRMAVIANFNPTLSERFQVRVGLQGRNGKWRGRAKGNYDFGSVISCNGRPPFGVQEISLKIELICTEGSDSIVLYGFIDVTVAKTNNRFTLRAVPLNCVSGGPTCTAEWSLLFFGQILGNGHITVRGSGD